MIMACLLLTCQGVFAASAAQRKLAISRVKEYAVALCEGNVAKLKRLTTYDYYRTLFPSSDAELKSYLLSVPYAKRMREKDRKVIRSEYSTFENRPGDVITVVVTDSITGEEDYYQLLDEYENGDWRIFNLNYQIDY